MPVTMAIGEKKYGLPGEGEVPSITHWQISKETMIYYFNGNGFMYRYK
jgi:hypothetical protein